MTIKYYIVDNIQRPMEVTESEQASWIKENEAKYNLHWKRLDGSKRIDLTFVGTKKNREELILFLVQSVFTDYTGEVVNDIRDEFDNYKDAREHYDLNIFTSGGSSGD